MTCTLCMLRALCALCTRCMLRALCALCTLCMLRALCALCTRCMLRALCALCTQEVGSGRVEVRRNHAGGISIVVSYIYDSPSR